MANSYHDRRWLIDTPGPLMVSEQAYHVKYIVWHGAGLTPISDQLIILDRNNHTLVHMSALGTDIEAIRSVESWWHDGFKVTVLGGGVCEIWHT